MGGQRVGQNPHCDAPICYLAQTVDEILVRDNVRIDDVDLFCSRSQHLAQRVPHGSHQSLVPESVVDDLAMSVEQLRPQSVEFLSPVLGFQRKGHQPL